MKYIINQESQIKEEIERLARDLDRDRDVQRMFLSIGTDDESLWRIAKDYAVSYVGEPEDVEEFKIQYRTFWEYLADEYPEMVEDSISEAVVYYCLKYAVRKPSLGERLGWILTSKPSK